VLRGLLAGCRIVTEASGGKDIEWAIDYLTASSAQIDAALVDVNAKMIQMARIEGGKVLCSHLNNLKSF